MASKTDLYPDFWREQLGNELDEIGPEAFARQHRAVAKDATPSGYKPSDYTSSELDRYLREQLLNASGSQIYAYAKKRFGADGVEEQDGEMAQAFGRHGVALGALGARAERSSAESDRTLEQLHQQWLDHPTWQALEVLLDAIEEKGGDREGFARKYVGDARDQGLDRIDLDALIKQGLKANGLSTSQGGLDADWVNTVWFLDDDGESTTVVLFEEDDGDDLSLVQRTVLDDDGNMEDKTLFTEYWTTAIARAAKWAKTDSFDGLTVIQGGKQEKWSVEKNGQYLTYDFGTGSIYFSVPGMAYEFPRAQAEQLAKQHGGRVVPQPSWNAKTKRYEGINGWRRKGEQAAKLAGTGPGAPEEDACLAGGEGWFQSQMAEDAVRHLKIPAEHAEEFKAGYAEGIKKWAGKLGKRKWCKKFREDEGF